MEVVAAIRYVDEVFLALDQDGSVCESIKAVEKRIKEKYWNQTQIVFGKGGDRFAGNIPEVQVCKELEIEIRDGLGMKTHNSSDFREKKI